MLTNMGVKKASIIIIGNEVLSGKVEEQNARFLIGDLRDLGVQLQSVHFIPDDTSTIVETVSRESARSDFVLTTGGVGPTHDDITIASISAAFNKKIIRHEHLEKLLRGYFGEAIDDVRLSMANVPEGAELIFDGGLKYPVIQCQNVYIFPGVPELLRRKFLAIRERFRSTPLHLRVCYTLEDEFDLVDRLNQVTSSHPDVQIGSYPDFESPHYRVKLTLESRSEEKLEAAHSELLSLLDKSRTVYL